MTISCEHCSHEVANMERMKTHMLLNHPSKLKDTTEYTSNVSKGFMDSEVQAEKGEQFGYRK